MDVETLKKELKSEMIKDSDTWLQNQYPARPSERCSSKTYLNYQNIEDCFDMDARRHVEKVVAEHPATPVVILAVLRKNGETTKKKMSVFIENEAHYYYNYELFAVAARMKGFVEVFHNIKR